MKSLRTKYRLIVVILVVAILVVVGGSRFRTRAQDNLTPGMLFGPLWVGDGQHIELCASNLGEGDIGATIHFRNLTNNEVTAGENIALPSGGGACSFYTGKGLVVGMARGEGRASDWVSPSNALISTMSVVDNGASARVAVLGNAKLWLRGL